MAGFDTASTITSVYQSAGAKWGQPKFWIRYFSPSPDAGSTINSSSSQANSECDAAWDSGAPKIGPISAPTQARLSSGSSAEGQADGQTFQNALWNFWLDVGPAWLPTNDILYVFLDLEGGTDLTLNYWNAWAIALFSFSWNGLFPLYPSLYCDPCNGHANCSVVHNGSVQAWAIWSSEPEYGKYCCYTMSNPPSCEPASCSDCGYQHPGPSILWQWAERYGSASSCHDDQYGNCYYDPNVDKDVGCNGVNYPDYCFYLSSRP